MEIFSITDNEWVNGTFGLVILLYLPGDLYFCFPIANRPRHLHATSNSMSSNIMIILMVHMEIVSRCSYTADNISGAAVPQCHILTRGSSISRPLQQRNMTRALNQKVIDPKFNSNAVRQLHVLMRNRRFELLAARSPWLACN